jgi:hypothetical protein
MRPDFITSTQSTFMALIPFLIKYAKQGQQSFFFHVAVVNI